MICWCLIQSVCFFNKKKILDDSISDLCSNHWLYLQTNNHDSNLIQGKQVGLLIKANLSKHKVGIDLFFCYRYIDVYCAVFFEISSAYHHANVDRFSSIESRSQINKYLFVYVVSALDFIGITLKNYQSTWVIKQRRKYQQN